MGRPNRFAWGARFHDGWNFVIGHLELHYRTYGYLNYNGFRKWWTGPGYQTFMWSLTLNRFRLLWWKRYEAPRR